MDTMVAVVNERNIVWSCLGYPSVMTNMDVLPAEDFGKGKGGVYRLKFQWNNAGNSFNKRLCFRSDARVCAYYIQS